MKIRHTGLDRLLFLFILVLGLSSSCNHSISPQSKEVHEEASKQLSSLVDGYFESYLELDPLFATSIGDHRFDDKLPISISKEQREKQMALVQSSLAKAKEISSKNLKVEDLLTYEMFVRDLQSEENLLQVDLDYLMPFKQKDSFFSDFAELAAGSSFITFDTILDYENFLRYLWSKI